MLSRVDFKSGVPVYRQLIEQIQAAAASGSLRPGEDLPNIGALAKELRVGRNHVIRAYSELESLGFIELRAGNHYRLKEHHQPLRKEVMRTETVLPSGAQQDFRRTLRSRHAGMALAVAVAYLAAVAAIAGAIVASGIVEGAVKAVLVTVLVAGVLLPLRNRAQRALEAMMFPKRRRVPEALDSLKADLWTHSGLDSYLESVIETTEKIVGVRPKLIRDHAEVLRVVNSFPSLRSTREPVRSGNDFLMPLFSHDEVFGILHLPAKGTGQGFDPEDWTFLRAIGREIALASNQFRVRNEKLESEYALDIQRALLPAEIPQPEGFTIAGAWQPAKLVGGDYYDVFPIAQERLALLVADVSGKGIPAALLMSNLQATVKAYAELSGSPQELCRRVNRAICGSISAGKFVTFFYAILDTRNHRLTYTNAGHNPPLLASADGQCHKLEAGGMVLGIMAETPFEQATVELKHGDRLVIFTDGIIEATDAHGKEFGDDRLFTAATAAADATANQLRDTVMQAVSHFCRGDFADDATLLIVACAEESRAGNAVEGEQALAAGR